MNCNLNRQEFEELLKQVGIGGDSGLINKIFYIFDYDGNGTIDFKELIMGLEIFKKDPIENKVKIFLRICEKDGQGYISQAELYNVLKKNTQNREEKSRYKTVCKQIFNESDQVHLGKLHFAEIYQKAIQNRMLRTLLEQNIQNVQYVDQVIDADLEEAFHQQPSVTLNFEKLHEGIHFPEVNKILKMYKEYEQCYYEGSKLRKAYQF